MLGWMLKRGDNAPAASADNGGANLTTNLNGRSMAELTLTAPSDTTQLDIPDTPAPVFAARALKSALFGTPAARDESRSKPTKTTTISNQASLTPISKKPQGILLTPGTGASRPKRVSFGQDVEVKATQAQTDPLAGKQGEPHKRTRLNEALEKARKKKVASVKKAEAKQFKPPASDDEWDDEDDETDDYCNHDVTLDLNEPHSQSGRYWKKEFEKYHDDAKVELEKLLKYKQLAKSYAQQKDAEAIELAEKLKDEQEKVINMEKKIAENASHIISRHENTSEDATPEMVTKLTKQTALAVQYRQRVQELEDQLEDFLEEKQVEAEGKGRRRRGQASPRTQKTIIETQRELRKARSQVKELGTLREQISLLKDQLKAAEKRAAKSEAGAKSEDSENLRAKDLRTQLRQAKEESKKKDEEMKQMKKEFEDFRQESRLHEEDTKAVIERAQTKIADLKKEIKILKNAAPELVHRPRPKSWHAQLENGKEGDDAVEAEEPVVKLRDSRRTASDEAPATRSLDRIGEWTPLAEISPQKPKFHRTLREKFREDAANNATNTERTSSAFMSGALKDKPTLEKPRWQPFVPRSPRNRAYLSEEFSNQNAGATPAASKANRLSAPDLQGLSKSISCSEKFGSGLKAEAQVDLLTDRFAKPGPEIATQKYSSATLENFAKNSKLPPERRAAAMARIEQRRAEKRQQRSGLDKENMRP